MLTAFVLAAMLATPTEEPIIAQIQERMEVHLRAFQNELAHVHQMFEGTSDDGFEKILLEPDTGMIIKSVTTPDNQGLHPLEVLAVSPGEPAAEVGIQPGDRITFIGERRIEHETNQVVRMILEKAPNPLSLTILRGQDGFCFAVTRRPLHCVQRAIEQFDRTKWLQGVETIQQQVTELQNALKQDPNDIALLREIAQELNEMNALIPLVIENMDRALENAAYHTCNPYAPKEE